MDQVPPESPDLSQRVRALEHVLALERKLRRSKEQTANALRQRLAQHVSHASAGAPPTVTLDPDSTRIAPAHHQTRMADQMQAAANMAALALPPGFRLLEYRIDQVLGQGGFGITYLATDINLNTRFAIKEYLPVEFSCRASDFSVVPRYPEDSQTYQTGLENFLYEARTLASFRHPHIVRVARFFEAYRTAYIVQEYEQGQSLRAWWRSDLRSDLRSDSKHQSNLPESELLSLLQPLLDGLAQVHASGYLHRDIKPDNVMVRDLNGSLVLLDFGAARQNSAGLQDLTPNVPIVTPGYAPPEQYQSQQQGPWTDIYAMGATLYWMVTGEKPQAAPLRAMAQQHGQSPMPGAQELAQGRYSVAFLQAIDAALSLDPHARPQSVAEFCQRLYANHSASLGLQEALRLRLGEAVKQRLRLGWLRRAAHPGSWPLSWKLSLAFVLAALMPMTMTAWYNLNGSIESVSSSELRNLERLAQSVAGRLAQLLNDSRHLASYLGRDADFIAYLRAPNPATLAELQTKITDLLATNPDVHRGMLLDRHGIALVSNDPAAIGSNSQFRDYFKQAMAGKSFTTGMLVSHIDAAPGIHYSNPVFDKNRQVVGVVVLRIKGGTVGNILDESTNGTGRVPFVIDGDGVLIQHPDARQLYHSLAALSPAKQGQIRADRRFGTAQVTSLNMPELARAMVAAKTHGNISYPSRISGSIEHAEHAGYAPVAGHDWVVGISEPRSQFEAPLTRLFNNVLYSVVLVGLLFLLLALLFARSIVRPILRLTEAAHALTEGDYEKANLKVDSHDEIGRLARTFNVMIDVLRQRERERARAGDKKP